MKYTSIVVLQTCINSLRFEFVVVKVVVVVVVVVVKVKLS